MTSIDQAFRKAYAKRETSTHDETVAVWIDEASGHSARHDTAHAIKGPHTRQKISKVPAAEPATPAPTATPTEDDLQPASIETESTIASSNYAYDAWSATLESYEPPTQVPPTRAIEPVVIPTPIPEPFTPLWEVDSFVIPTVARQLIDHHLAGIGEQLGSASREGLRSLAISSQGRNVGRSTVAIAIAAAAAAGGLRVALVDGDTENPSLVDKLQLDLSVDWIDVIAADQKAEEAAVVSLENDFSFLPLLEKPAEQLRHVDQCAEKLLDRLKHHFDLIVVDFGPLQGGSFGTSIPLTSDLIDAVILVEDMRSADTEMLESFARRIRTVGIDNIGLIENYAA